MNTTLEKCRVAVHDSLWIEAVQVCFAEQNPAYRTLACEYILGHLEPRRWNLDRIGRDVRYCLDVAPQSAAEGQLRWLLFGECRVQYGKKSARYLVGVKDLWAAQLENSQRDNQHVVLWINVRPHLRVPGHGHKATRCPETNLWMRANDKKGRR